MNTNLQPPTRWEHWALLDASGELSGWKRHLLHRKLARSPELRAYRQDFEAHLSSSSSTDIPPWPETSRAAILDLAEAQLTRRRPAPAPAWPRFAPACALALLLLLGGAGIWWVDRPATDLPVAQTPPPATSDDFAFLLDEEADTLDDLAEPLLLAMLTDPDLMTLNDLAEELLMWENNL